MAFEYADSLGHLLATLQGLNRSQEKEFEKSAVQGGTRKEKKGVICHIN